MVETTFQVRLPAPLLRLGLGEEEIQSRITEWLVLSLFSDGHVSSGKAARLLDMSRVEFLALLRKRGIAYLDYSGDDIREEFEAAQKLGPKPKA